jgi:cystathionine beta-lyase
MQYDFTHTPGRRGTNCVKWDMMSEGVIPLWVADMDFPVAPAIQKAVADRAAHPVYGYTLVPDAYYDAIISWFHRKHHWDIQREWILYTTGILPALSCTLHALTLPGEKVVMMTPVYNCFYSSLQNQGCVLSASPLKRMGTTFVIDFDDLERRCSDPKATALLLCNPHNPAGRMWTAEELRHVGDICARHHVRVISDEVHCEICMPGHTFTPFASVSDTNQQISVTLSSASKSFNMAGLQIANVICSDADTLRRIDRVVNIYEACDVNPFGPVATIAAYNEGEAWLKGMNQQVWDNYLYLKQTLAVQLPEAELMDLEGTYLAWIDVSRFNGDADSIDQSLLRNNKVFLSAGNIYGPEGNHYLRLNLATSPTTLREGVERMIQGLKQIGLKTASTDK